MIEPKSNIVWADVETTGIDATTNRLLEIAVIVTDSELNILDEEGYHAVIRYEQDDVIEMRKRSDRFVQEMHDKTGLWGKLFEPDAKELHRVESELLLYLMRFGGRRTMPVGGNSVRLDMNFIDEFLPEVGAYLDYHMRDVSTVAGLAADWYDLPWFEKKSDHTAAVDIRESIRELKHLREAIFAKPGEEDLRKQIASQEKTIKGLTEMVKALNGRIALQALRAGVSETDEKLVKPLKVDGSLNEHWLKATPAQLREALAWQGLITRGLLEEHNDFTIWAEVGRAHDWVGPAVCSTHDGIPMSEAEETEFEDGDPCIHILRLYADSATAKAVEENHAPSVWRKP